MVKNKKDLIIVLCSIIVLLIACVSGYIIYKKAQSGELQESNKDIQTKENKMFCKEVEERHIAFDKETGLQYADNQLLLTAALETEKENVEDLIAPYQAKIVGMIDVTNIYQIEFNKSYKKEELDKIGKELCSTGKIKEYDVNAVMNIDIENSNN